MVLKLKGHKINISVQAAKTLSQSPTLSTEAIKREVRPSLQKVSLEPLELTRALLDELVIRVERGLNFEAAALASRVGLKQFQYWLNTGLGVQDKLEESQEPLEVSQHLALCYELVTKIRSGKALVMERALMELLASTDWKSKAWFLEKAGGEYFAKKELVTIEMQHTPLPGGEDFNWDKLSVNERKVLVDLIDKITHQEGLEQTRLISATVGDGDAVDAELVEVETDSK